MAVSILIVEDDLELLRILELNLQDEGYTVWTASDGLTGLQSAKDKQPDLVMLDVDLPGLDGLTVCLRIREFANMPILMMSGHAISEDEIVKGLNVGADEYMVKPMPDLILKARVQALLRRTRMEPVQANTLNEFDDGYLSVNITTRRVMVDGQEIRLTPTEFKLLSMLIRNPDHVLTFQQLLEEVWGVEYKTEHHYPRIYVSHLRRKIEPNPQTPVYIQSEYGVGYRFIGKSQSAV